MRNLKKVLALVLVFVMSFALVINASAYTYKDQAKIDSRFVDAINMMYELKIMQGDTNGNFLPENALRRSELAKMIFVIMNKGNTNATAYANVTGIPFKDYKATDWYSGYINWSYISKLVAGKTASKFAPIDNVTGFEAAKFILGAMGYRSDIEKYTGSGWSLNVLRDASSVGLLEGLEDLDMNKPLQRQHAAQMLYNALFGEMVAYSTGDIVTRYLDTVGKTIAQKYFGLQTMTGVLDANEWIGITGAAANAGRISITGGNSNGNGTNLETTADISMLGREVKLFVKADINTDGNVTKVYKVYGKPVLSTSETAYTAVAGDLKIQGTNGTENAISYTTGGKTYVTAAAQNVAATSVLYVNFVKEKANANGGAADIDFASASLPVAQKSNPVTVIIKNGKIERILACDYTFGKIGVSASSKYSLTRYEGAGTLFSNIDKADIVIGDDLAVKDAFVFGRAIGSKYELVKIDELTGVVTNNIGSDKSIIDSKTYTQGFFDGADDTFAFATSSLGKENTFFAYGTLLMGAKAVAEETKTYCVVIDSSFAHVAGSTSTATAYVLSDDGKKVAYTVAALYDTTAPTPNKLSITNTNYATLLAEGKIFRYKLSSDGKEITLYQLAGTFSHGFYDKNVPGGGVNMKVDDGANGVGALDKRIADASVFFMQYGTDWYLYKNRSVSSFGLAGAFLPGYFLADTKTQNANDTITVAAIMGLAAPAPGSGTAVALRGILTEDAQTAWDSTNNKQIINYKLFNGTEVKTYTATVKGGGGALDPITTYKAGSVLMATAMSGDVLTTYTEPTWEHADGAAGLTIYGGYIQYKDGVDLILARSDADKHYAATTKMFQYTADVKVYRLAAGDWETVTKADLAATDADAALKDKANVIVVLDAAVNGKIAAIYINSDGTWSNNL